LEDLVNIMLNQLSIGVVVRRITGRRDFSMSSGFSASALNPLSDRLTAVTLTRILDQP